MNYKTILKAARKRCKTAVERRQINALEEHLDDVAGAEADDEAVEALRADIDDLESRLTRAQSDCEDMFEENSLLLADLATIDAYLHEAGSALADEDYGAVQDGIESARQVIADGAGTDDEELVDWEDAKAELASEEA